MQWGSFNASQNVVGTITLPVSFTANNYSLCATQGANNEVGEYINCIYIYNRTTTTFKYKAPGKGTTTWTWIAIGY